MACDTEEPPYDGCMDDLSLRAYNFFEKLLGIPYPIPTWSSTSTIFKQVKWSDIVHIHDCLYATSILAVMASILFSKPVVVTQHIGIVPYKEKIKKILQNLAYLSIGKFVLKRADKVVFINEKIKKWFESELRLSKTDLIPNGVNRRVFYPANAAEKTSIRTKLLYSENDVVLLFVGRFTQKKGVDLIKELARRRPNYQWLIIGKGEIDVYQWKLPNIRVYSPQIQTELRNFYVASDIFILPSTGEGFPLVVQEAMSCGVPSAVSEETANSLSEAPLIRLDISTPNQILETLDEILYAPDKTVQLQQRSKKFAERWDWDITAHQYEELFIKTTKKY